jgi:hypothetical protein
LGTPWGRKRPEKTFGIPRRSVSKIAEADSTSVFSGLFLPQGLHKILWVKFRFRIQGGILDLTVNKIQFFIK